MYAQATKSLRMSIWMKKLSNQRKHTISCAGKLDESYKLKSEALQALVEVQGAEHPDTLFARHCLAGNLEKQGMPSLK